MKLESQSISFNVKSNLELVEKLKQRGHITSGRIEDAFVSVDRAQFVPKKHSEYAYRDRPLGIGETATISAPHMVAMATEILNPEEYSDVLEIGSGSGYQLAILSELSENVTGIEIDKNLAEKSRMRLENQRNVRIVHGDGLEAAEGKFDRILYSCAIDEQEFDRAKRKLNDNGKLVAPLTQNGDQIYSSYQNGETKKHTRVRFVRMR